MSGPPLAVVTGSAGDIGGAIVRALGAAGREVLTVDVQEAEDPLHLAADLADPQASRRIRDRLTGLGRQVDLLVHCAALSRKLPLQEVSDHDVDQLVAVNMRAPLLLTRDLLPLFADSASVVPISSIRAARGFADDVVYQMTKGALESMTRALAIELAPRGIRVNAVAPGAVETAMTAPVRQDPRRFEQAVALIPARRFGLPDEIADAVLSITANPYITGQVLRVDGGQSVRG